MKRPRSGLALGATLSLLKALFSTGAVGCEGPRELSLLEDEAVGLGGGSVRGQSSPTSAGGATATRDTPVTLIDDFWDCDERIIPVAGRDGYWYHFVEPSVNRVQVRYRSGMPPTSQWGTQRCGIYLTGGCASCDSAGVGFQLAEEGWDLSPYVGLRVSFESETSLWAVIVTKDGTRSGYSEYVRLEPTGGISGVRELPFDAIYPGNGFQGLEFAREIQFTVGARDRAAFGLGIHRVELIEGLK